jgi:GDP-4-dehydro-6-deoxy-D-mannose reductase
VFRFRRNPEPEPELEHEPGTLNTERGTTVSQRTLITGASGFAGSHLVEHLAAAGRDEIVGWRRADVDLLDVERVRAGIRELRPSQIYHCAGASHVAGSWQATSETLAGNVLGTHHLLDAVRRAGLTCRVLIPSAAHPLPKTTRSSRPARMR